MEDEIKLLKEIVTEMKAYDLWEGGFYFNNNHIRALESIIRKLKHEGEK